MKRKDSAVHTAQEQADRGARSTDFHVFPGDGRHSDSHTRTESQRDTGNCYTFQMPRLLKLQPQNKHWTSQLVDRASFEIFKSIYRSLFLSRRGEPLPTLVVDVVWSCRWHELSGGRFLFF